MKEYGVDEIDKDDISLIDLDTGLPLIVLKNDSQEVSSLKEGDTIMAQISPTLCKDDTPNCLAFGKIQKL